MAASSKAIGSSSTSTAASSALPRKRLWLSSPSLPGGSSKHPREKPAKPAALWWLLGALFVLALVQAYFMTPAGRQIPYSEFKALLRGGQVAEVAVGDTLIRGTLTKPVDGKAEFSTTRIDD